VFSIKFLPQDLSKDGWFRLTVKPNCLMAAYEKSVQRTKCPGSTSNSGTSSVPEQAGFLGAEQRG
jgi:hypothetical protein